LPSATVTARLLDLSGAELATMTFADAFVDAELRAPTPAGAFVVDLQFAAGEVRAERRYVLTGAEDFAELLDQRIEIDAECHGDSLTVRHVSGPVAPFVRVRDGRPRQGDAGGWLRVSDSGFVLLPGEERTIDIDWSGAGGNRMIAIDGLGIRPGERVIRCS
jgi:beta-mannosidase